MHMRGSSILLIVLILGLARVISSQTFEPYPEKAALMVFAAHQDDEGLWGGGMLPYYSLVRNLPVIWVVTGTTPTESRIPEADTAAVRYGLRYKPIQLFEYSNLGRDANCATMTLDTNWLATMVGLIRRYKPDVIVTHSHIGEYTWGDNCTGHPQHLLTNRAMLSAFDLSADSTKFARQLDTLDVWQVKKIYEYQPGYLWGATNPAYLTHDWDTPYAALGGKTSFEVSVEALRSYYAGSGSTETFDKWGYHCWQFLLAKTSVGPDVVKKDDFFENAYIATLDSNHMVLSSSGGLSRNLTLTLKSPLEPITALSAMKSSSWLSVSIQVSGNNRILVNSANPAGLQSGVYSDTVTLSGPGIWGMKYAVTLQVAGSPVLASIRITPPRPSVYPGDTVHFTAAGYDQFGARLAAQPAFTWAGTTGPGSSTFVAGTVSAVPYAVTASAGGVQCSTKVSVITFSTIHVDIDTTQYRGVLSVSKGTYSLTGTPDADIWSTDKFYFAYMPVVGDFDVSVRLDSVRGMANYSKPGLMFRDELTPWCRFADFYYQQGGSYGWLIQQVPGAFDVLFGSISVPCWMRFARTANVINSYLSSDGETWTRVSGREMITTGEDYLGLYCAGNSASPTVVFSNLQGFYGSQPASVPVALHPRSVPDIERGPYTLRVYSLNGRLAKECVVARTDRMAPALGRTGLAPGMYYTMVRDKRGAVLKDGVHIRTKTVGNSR